MNDKEFFCTLTAQFWKYYLMEPTKEHFEEMFTYFSEQLVLIGTGKHEFYTSLSTILESLSGNQVEAESVSFQVLDEWYECMVVTQDVFLVYGGIWVRQQGQPEDKALIEMDTRFSLLYRRRGEACELLHVHHSIPYAEQQQGEYYPKTLSEQAKEAMDLAELFKRQSEMDLMTELYNSVSFQHHVVQCMEKCGTGNLYLFDLDYFKSVNDTYGHITGDSLLKLFSRMLKEAFSTDAMIGRLGGDEFAVFEYAPPQKELAVQKVTQLQQEFGSAAQKILIQGTASFSVGIGSMTKEQRLFDSIFANADRALYHAKKLGRKTYYWHCD